MKRILTLILTLAIAFTLAACSASPVGTPEASPVQTERVSVKIGITGESENVIWAPVIEKLATEGIDIEIINFADYTLLNGSLVDGDIDLNAFQHYAFLNNQIADKGYDIVAIGDTYISAMCIYSDKIGDISELKKGDKIAIPNDEVNWGRALSVAQGAGIITLGEPDGDVYDIKNIISNPLEIEFVQVDGSQIPSLLPDVTAGIINGNYALDFGLSPKDDAIFYDDVSFYSDNRYVNNIVARAADKDNPVYLKIVDAYQSGAVEQVYKDAFEGSYLPGWKSLSSASAVTPAERVTVKIGVTDGTARDIWAPAAASLAKEGIDIEFVDFADYSLPNEALNSGEIDLNAFQHHAFLNNQIKDKGYQITAIGDTLLAAMCVYSEKINDLSELKNGDKIAIPNDAVNLGRALSVLQGAGVITLREVEGSPEIGDIIENPKDIELVQVDASQIAALLPDVAAGVINGGYAVDFGFKPLEDSIFYDDLSFYADNRFVNVIVARTADINNEIYQRVVKAYQSEEVAKVLQEQFAGAYLPAWK